MGVGLKVMLISLLISVTYALQRGDDPSKTHFVLVHGRSQGGWTWYKMKASLESHGFKVWCPDLKSAGIDPTPATSVPDFSSYNQPLMQVLSEIPKDEKVVLVGHSDGGLSLTEAMYKFGHKIQVYVFVSAVMSRRGILKEDDTKMGLLIKYGLERTMGEHAVKAYNVTPPEDLALYQLLAKRSPPYRIFEDATYPEKPEIEKLNRVYVRCLHDMVLKPSVQSSMIQKWPPTVVFDMLTDHNAHLASPSELTKVLIEIANIRY